MTRTVTLIGVDGVEVGPLRVGEGPALWGAAPTVYDTLDLPDGYELSGFRNAPRDNVLPVLVDGDDASEFEARVRALIRSTDPRRGQVRVLVTDADGATRELSAFVVGGRDALTYAIPDTSILTLPLRLRSTQNWRATVETEIRVGWDDFETEFVDIPFDDPPDYLYDPPPDLPWSGLSLRGYLDVTLEANGDEVSWPVYRITGPASTVEIVNQRTAGRWQFDGAIDEGQVLVVDTNPGRRTITVDEIPAFAQMGNGWVWHKLGLEPGDNPTHVWIENFGTSTSLEVTYYSEWATP